MRRYFKKLSVENKETAQIINNNIKALWYYEPTKQLLKKYEDSDYYNKIYKNSIQFNKK